MKRYTKLLAALLLLITAVVMVITTSFAWLTLSDTPVADGIQIAISGSHTVLVAPDITYTQDGVTYHYPGAFSDSLNFSDYEQYDYLNEAGGLVPVSTADGQTWYIPVYKSQNMEFIADDTLSYANLSPEVLDDTQQGNYLYLDFWVVAPVDGYKLRVSTGAEGIGTFVIDLPDPEFQDGTYTLTDDSQQTAASVRLGFLVNESTLLDQSMYYYSRSAGFHDGYDRLQGIYTEPGSVALYASDTRFVIFEPNGDLHPTVVTDSNGRQITNGQYVITQPLGKDGLPTSVSDRLTVQLTNSWVMAGESTYISQVFSGLLMSKGDLSGWTVQSLREDFYERYLQRVVYPYVIKGNFLANTGNLYTTAGIDSIAQPEELQELLQAGATEDVYLTELTGGVPQRIRLFIWLEGQDVDCINSAAGGGIAVSIELAGSNAS